MTLTRVKTNGDTSAYAASTDALTIAVPSAESDGFLMTLHAMHDNGSQPLAITGGGWTLREDGTATALTTRLWTRVASSEPADYEITASVSANFHAVMIIWDPDGDPLDTIDAADSTTDDANSQISTTLSVTAVTNGCFVAAFSNDGNKTVDVAPTGTEIYQFTGSSTAFGVYAQEGLGAGGITDEMDWSANDQVEAQALTMSATAVGAARYAAYYQQYYKDVVLG